MLTTASTCRIFIVNALLKKSERVDVSLGCSPKQPASVPGSDVVQRVACRLSLIPNQALPKPGCVLVSRQHLLQEPSLSKSKLLRTRKAFKGSPASSLSLVPQEGRSHKDPGQMQNGLGSCSDASGLSCGSRVRISSVFLTRHGVVSGQWVAWLSSSLVLV